MIHVATYEDGRIREWPDMSPEKYRETMQRNLKKNPDGFFAHGGRQFENDPPDYSHAWVGQEEDEEAPVDLEAKAAQAFKEWREKQTVKKRRIRRDDEVPQSSMVMVQNISMSDVYASGGIRVPAWSRQVDPETKKPVRHGPVKIPVSDLAGLGDKVVKVG
jgi:hypothetical protein